MIETGQHVITVLFANQPVPQSPFIIVVDSTHNAAQCIASGPGIEKNSNQAGRPTYFTIDARKAGKAKPSIAFTAPAADPHIVDNGVSYGVHENILLEPPCLPYLLSSF